MGVQVTLKVTIPSALRHLAERGFAEEWRAAHAQVAQEASQSATFQDRTGQTRASIGASVEQSGVVSIARLWVGTTAGAVWEFGMRPQNVIYRRKGRTVNVSRDPLPQRLFLRKTMRRARAEFIRAMRARLEGV